MLWINTENSICHNLGKKQLKKQIKKLFLKVEAQASGVWCTALAASITTK